MNESSPTRTPDEKRDAVHEHIGHVHVVPMRVLVGVIVALLVLTWVTVAATWFDFGYTGNILIALGIATVKASLVALYFMHLRYDNLFNGIVLISALVFVAVLIGIALLDTRRYQPDMYVTPTPPGSVISE
jgi:cytochrome c oxidase subunit 4